MRRLNPAFFLTVALLCASCTSVEEASIAAKVGINIAHVETAVGQVTTDSDTTTGFTIGAEVNKPIKESCSFRTGLQYSTKGGELAGLENTLGLLEIPAIFNFSLASGKVYAATGINLGFVMSAEDGNGVSFEQDLGTLNLDLVLGGGVVLADGKFRAGIQYELGLIDLSDLVNVEYKSRNLQIVATYSF
jgi:hypothetical protein